MKILLVGSEVAPIIKIGGLGDVMGALPKALSKIGVNCDVIVPFFPVAISNVSSTSLYKSRELNVPFGGANYPVDVFKTKLPDSDVDVFLLKNDEFFGGGGVAAFDNNISETEMFMFFNRSVAEFVKSQFNTYDLVHCNDWHTGVLTHILKDELDMTRPATLFTVHNVVYQGVGDLSSIESVGLNLLEHPLIEWDISDGDVNMMLQGITSSDFISTVSPSYAKELLSDEFGGGFNDIFTARQGRLVGILNGIDYTSLHRNFDIHDVSEGKLAARMKLYDKLEVKMPLDAWLKKPLFSYIGRIDPGQKGLDLLEGLFANPEFADSATFVLLGVGDFGWEEKFKKLGQELSNFYPNIIFDEKLALEIYAGSDFLLVPSKYEPCGLIQMMAMYYGTLPIVRGVGGLKDSVKDGVTGFVFDEYSIEAFVGCVRRALEVYGGTEDTAGTVGNKVKSRFNLMAQNAMREDFSWDKSAIEYKKLYEKVIKIRQLFKDNP